MSEKDIRLLSLFFFFAYLDSKRAMEATAQALQWCERKKEKNPQINTDILIVMATHKEWTDHLELKIRQLPASTADGGWILPERTDLGPWREFLKSASQDELLIVIWAKILNFPFSIISEALGVTEGTLRYRMARAVRKLGAMTHLFPRKMEMLNR